MYFFTRVVYLIAIALLMASPVFSQKRAKTVYAENKTRIEKIVREYILKNPFIIRDAIDLLQAQEAEKKQILAAENLKKYNSEIYSDKDSPVAGNPKGDVTIVTFFDYNCGYCKKSLPALQTLIATDSAVKIIYKEFPILGPDSFLAAQAALAAKRQGKYDQFHQALLGVDQVNEETIKAIAEQLAINYETLVKDMTDPQVQEELSRNTRLAMALDINGTPAYIIGDQIIPGAIDIDGLINRVSSQRAKLRKTKSVK
jgi:protein-disulfide isomerase